MSSILFEVFEFTAEKWRGRDPPPRGIWRDFPVAIKMSEGVGDSKEAVFSSRRALENFKTTSKVYFKILEDIFCKLSLCTG